MFNSYSEGWDDGYYTGVQYVLSGNWEMDKYSHSFRMYADLFARWKRNRRDRKKILEQSFKEFKGIHDGETDTEYRLRKEVGVL